MQRLETAAAVRACQIATHSNHYSCNVSTAFEGHAGVVDVRSIHRKDTPRKYLPGY